jgi:hypothetical protein
MNQPKAGIRELALAGPAVKLQIQLTQLILEICSGWRTKVKGNLIYARAPIFHKKICILTIYAILLHKGVFFITPSL